MCGYKVYVKMECGKIKKENQNRNWQQEQQKECLLLSTYLVGIHLARILRICH